MPGTSGTCHRVFGVPFPRRRSNVLSRKALLRAGAVLVAAAAVVSGCSDASSGGGGDKAATTTTTDINEIQVSGKFGEEPKVEVPTPTRPPRHPEDHFQG